MRKLWTLPALCVTTVLLMNGLVSACSAPPPSPPPQYWVESHGIQPNGKWSYWIGMEIDLFAPTAPTNCTCGLNFSGVVPAGFSVEGAMITITDINTHVSTPLPEFSFASNPNTTSGLNGQFGGNFAGFASAVPAFTAPVLGPNEVFKLWFDVQVDVGATLNGSIGLAAGEGDSLGNPDFTGPHPTISFDPPINPNVNVTAVPEPSTWMLMLLPIASFISCEWLRRKRDKKAA